MRIWTLQPLTVYEQLLQEKVLVARPELGSGDCYEKEYAWMRGQMARHVPRYQGGPLWWGYALKPDLRIERHYHMPGPHVRLELDVAEAELLLSDWDDWTCVLNKHFYRSDRDESDALEEKWQECLRSGDVTAIATMEAAMEATWEGILVPFPLTEERANRSLQAGFEFLRLADVQEVRPFQGAFHSAVPSSV